MSAPACKRHKQDKAQCTTIRGVGASTLGESADRGCSHQRRLQLAELSLNHSITH